MNPMWLSPALAAVLVAQPAFADAAVPVDQAVEAFQSLCAGSPLEPAAVLAKASEQGWRSAGVDAPKTFDPLSQRLAPLGRGPLILKATSEVSSGERRDACSIAINVVTTGLEAAVQKCLGFPPSFAMGRSATYFAVRDGNHWLPGTLGKPEFDEAKAKGRFYTIMVLDRGAEEQNQGAPASIALLRVMPDVTL